MGRVLHLFHGLHQLATTVATSLLSLIWAIILLCGSIYVLSILFTQVAIQMYKTKGGISDDMDQWFGSIPRTSLTLIECILGGVSWDAPYMVLYDESGPLAAILLLIWSAVGLCVLLNVITGIFVEKTMRASE